MMSAPPSMYTSSLLVGIQGSMTPTNSGNTFENDTLDIMRKGCFGDYDTVACIRNGVLASLAFSTLLFCLTTTVRLHMYKHPNFHQYAIFYVSSVESLIACVHWLLNLYPQLDFILQYLKLVQFVVMCHFYWMMATRVLKKESLTRQVVTPVLLVGLVYFTIIVTLAIVNTQSFWIECLQPYWIELSSAEFLLVQLFMIAGFYITRRLNEISTLDSVRWQQKRDLWCIIIVFEVSALTCLVYDTVLLILGDEENGCSGIFLHIQELYSPVYIGYMIIKLLLPIWVMLYVFRPLPPCHDMELILPVPFYSEDGTYASAFTPTIDDNQYRQLYQPGIYYQSVDDSPTSPILQHHNSGLEPITEENKSESAQSNANSIVESNKSTDLLKSAIESQRSISVSESHKSISDSPTNDITNHSTIETQVNLIADDLSKNPNMNSENGVSVQVTSANVLNRQGCNGSRYSTPTSVGTFYL